MSDRMVVVQADITKQEVDAIVNAANQQLIKGGGVDGAIHRAAGPKLQEECHRIKGGCPTGEARITKGYGLPARHVIHAVGPRWHGGGKGEAELLASCYRNALRLAVENEVKTLAFPGISTGVYGYPLEEATRIAISNVAGVLEREPAIEQVRFVTFGDEATEVAKRVLAEVQKGTT
jgi:O-acetyl-ADP-ribose deacetylase (regulator of RNase III)